MQYLKKSHKIFLYFIMSHCPQGWKWGKSNLEAKDLKVHEEISLQERSFA